MTLPFLERYIKRGEVLKLLIHYRCKEAERIQRLLVVDNLASKKEKSGKQGKNLNEVPNNGEELYSLFPPRRQWVHSGRDNRSGLTQIAKNEMNLLLTVRREKKRECPHPEWYIRLNERIDKIVRVALSGDDLFSKPKVSVIEKKRKEEDKTLECRPICQFKTLDERIYASLYNKVFTHLFDPLFYENALAFRVPKPGDPQMLHLKAVRKIKEFRKTYSGNLWVAECDMKSFYDTLDHDVIKKRFSQMLHWQKRDGVINIMEARVLKKVIYSYVNCFGFCRDVYLYNYNKAHLIWKRVKCSKEYTKFIKWILDDIEDKRTQRCWPYRTQHHEMCQLGVPQGGALSGVIANVMMHFTDMKLKQYWHQHDDFLYLRFCDDMIMIGKEREQVAQAFEKYSECIKSDHLYMHPPVPFTGHRMKGFWEGKTRPPYQWGFPGKDVFPWITFVGYDVNWEGDTRIRRKSVKSEIKKQYEKRVEIEHLLHEKHGRNPQWTRRYISNSVHKRMIGMSVGRVHIWDYKEFDNSYSWAKAFTELTDNPWSRRQLRHLDWHRNLMMKKLGKFLLKLEYKEIKPSDDEEELKNALRYFGKPFSYYGQVLKKWKK